MSAFLRRAYIYETGSRTGSFAFFFVAVLFFSVILWSCCLSAFPFLFYYFQTGGVET